VLVIGVADYQNEDINDPRFADKDARAVAKSLEQNAGFAPENVRVMTTEQKDSPLYPSLGNVLASRKRMTSEAGEDDLFLLYFSGHSFEQEASHFLAPADVSPKPGMMPKTALSMSDLKTMLRKVRARQFVFVLDAGRSDPLRAERGVDAGMDREFSRQARELVERGTRLGPSAAYLLSCSRGQRSHEWPEKEHGVFTYYLLQGLAGAASDKETGEVTADSLARHTQRGAPVVDAEQQRNGAEARLHHAGTAHRAGQAPAEAACREVG
jgi:uncharacterized caspase-like protein